MKESVIKYGCHSVRVGSKPWHVIEAAAVSHRWFCSLSMPTRTSSVSGSGACNVRISQRAGVHNSAIQRGTQLVNWRHSLSVIESPIAAQLTTAAAMQQKVKAFSSTRHSSDETDDQEHHLGYNDPGIEPQLHTDRIVDVVKIAEDIRASVRAYTSVHAEGAAGKRAQIKLVGIMTHSDKESDAHLYSMQIEMACREDGIVYELWRIEEDCNGDPNVSRDGDQAVHRIQMQSDPSAVEAAIRRANNMADVHGVLVYYPIFKGQKKSLPITSESSPAQVCSDRQPWCAPTKPKNHDNSGDHDCHTPSKRNYRGEQSIRGPYKSSITGVYYKSYDDYLRDIICPTRDVEGLCHEYNARWMFRHSDIYVDNNNDFRSGYREVSFDQGIGYAGDEEDQGEDGGIGRGPDGCHGGIVFPCTALSVVRILEACHATFQPNRPVGLRFGGTIVTIINRSEILGRPLAAMLANDGATVYSVDEESVLLFRAGGRMRRCTDPETTLEWCIGQSSVVVTGVPSRDFKIPCEWIRPNSTVVNVAADPNVDEESVLRIPGVQYVPKVGKVTVAVLEHNLICLHRQHHARIEK